MKFLKGLAIAAIMLGVFAGPFTSAAQTLEPIDFFYSETCPHCIAEQGFLDELQTKYPAAEINRLVVTEKENVELLTERLTTVDAKQYLGVVPVTFVGEQFFIGFDDAETTGAQIEKALLGETVSGDPVADTCDEEACAPGKAAPGQ